jgi:hypothetical protein
MNRETFGLLSIITDWSTGESTLTWTGNQPGIWRQLGLLGS